MRSEQHLPVALLLRRPEQEEHLMNKVRFRMQWAQTGSCVRQARRSAPLEQQHLAPVLIRMQEERQQERLERPQVQQGDHQALVRQEQALAGEHRLVVDSRRSSWLASNPYPKKKTSRTLDGSNY